MDLGDTAQKVSESAGAIASIIAGLASVVASIASFFHKRTVVKAAAEVKNDATEVRDVAKSLNPGSLPRPPRVP